MKFESTSLRRAPLAAGISLALATGLTQAATFNVTTNADSGAGSLRQAIIDANAAAGPHTIDMTGVSSSTVTLASNLPGLTEQIDVVGSDATVDGAGSYSCFYSYGYSLSIADLTVTNCAGTYSGGYYYGGGVFVDGGDLTISGSTISTNSTDQGGGIFLVAGNLDLSDSVVTGNSAQLAGGVAVIGGSATITDSTVSQNYASQYFGAGYWYADYGFSGETISVSGSTFSGNTAGAAAAGPTFTSYVYLVDGTVPVALTNTTISGNSAPTLGGLYIRNQGFYGKYGNLDPQLVGTTITGNSATGGGGGGFTMANYGGSYYGYAAYATIQNSIIQGNSATSGSGDLETDAVVTATTSAQPGLESFHVFAANHPGQFGRWTRERFQKAGLEGTPTDQQISEFFTGRTEVPRGGGGNNITFTANFSIIGVAPTTGTFNADTATSGAIGSDPQLGPLADNGGPTQTHSPGAAGSGVDFIPNGDGGCGTTFTVDQHGDPRPEAAGGACDAGSVEVGGGGGGPGIPESTSVPTLNRWTTGLLALGLAFMGWVGLRRRNGTVKTE